MATIDNFIDEINDVITEYSDSIKKELEKTLDDTADKVLDYVRNNAPRSGRSKPLAEEFIRLDKGTGHNKTVIIYAKEKGKLVHLLEFGFQHRNGKYIAARPFMRPAFDTFTPEMLDEIRSIIRGK